MMNEQRIAQARVARKLQEVLGRDFTVSFDTCESGNTDIYFRGKLFKTVPNSEMVPDLNVCDYRPDYNWYMRNGVYA